MLSRLEVGLADEGVRVIHAVPDGEAVRSSSAGVFRSMVTYSRRVMTLMRGVAARQVVRAIADMDDADEPEPIDLVHVFGGSVWGLGERLAAELSASVALEVWRPGLIHRAVRMSARVAEPRPVFFAPDPATEAELRQQPVPVRPTYWGVHAAESPRRVLQAGRAPTVMFIGSGRDAKRCQAAFQGTVSALRAGGEGLVFVDSLVARRAGLWGVAESMDVLDRVTLIEELESRRDLLLQGDILMQCEPMGEQKTVILEAMSTGMLVVSAADRSISSLISGRTATLVEEPTATAWSGAVKRLLEHPGEREAIAASAHQYIRTSRLASAHIRAVLDAYAWMTSSGSIPFVSRDV